MWCVGKLSLVTVGYFNRFQVIADIDLKEFMQTGYKTVAYNAL